MRFTKKAVSVRQRNKMCIRDRGSNYKAKTIDLNKTITSKRYPTPTKPYTVSGTKGKLVDGKQWYTSDVDCTDERLFDFNG